MRFVFAAVAEDRRGGRLDRRGATVSRGRRGGLRRPRRDPVEGVEPGGLGIRAGDTGGCADVCWTSDGGGVAAGWWRRVAAWSANGCRLMCTLPQGGGTAGSHADADAATVRDPRDGLDDAAGGQNGASPASSSSVAGAGLSLETLRGRQADERARDALPHGGDGGTARLAWSGDGYRLFVASASGGGGVRRERERGGGGGGDVNRPKPKKGRLANFYSRRLAPASRRRVHAARHARAHLLRAADGVMVVAGGDEDERAARRDAPGRVRALQNSPRDGRGERRRPRPRGGGIARLGPARLQDGQVEVLRP